MSDSDYKKKDVSLETNFTLGKKSNIKIFIIIQDQMQ